MSFPMSIIKGSLLLATPYPYAPADRARNCERLDASTRPSRSIRKMSEPCCGRPRRSAYETVLLPKRSGGEHHAGGRQFVCRSGRASLDRADRESGAGARAIRRSEESGSSASRITRMPVILGQTPIPTPCVLVVGSEGQGMGPNLAKRCDLLAEDRNARRGEFTQCGNRGLDCALRSLAILNSAFQSRHVRSAADRCSARLIRQRFLEVTIDGIFVRLHEAVGL